MLVKDFIRSFINNSNVVFLYNGKRYFLDYIEYQGDTTKINLIENMFYPTSSSFFLSILSGSIQDKIIFLLQGEELDYDSYKNYENEIVINLKNREMYDSYSQRNV